MSHDPGDEHVDYITCECGARCCVTVTMDDLGWFEWAQHPGRHRCGMIHMRFVQHSIRMVTVSGTITL